ncbi:DUF7351 domain-containing protein [Haloplanus pelagicus]|jgi:hypothetical protein|uniref:DUF7351 domain-containing protein n=1 Tax=Haloplanus pelagicus TaxID=2949995 RepID=UPI00203DD7CF|nr:hypothetical protein [Haloplanus sp. HW8-1]
MTGTADEVPADIDPQDAFQLFSHELRLEILFALWDAPDYSLPFSEMQTAVGERDSGKFTYHLEKLTGHFVAEIDGQYVLQYAGHRVVDAIQSGVFHTSPTVEAVAAPGVCPTCGASPTFDYDDHLATVTCSSCGTKLIEYPFDPGGFQGRSLDAAIDAFDDRTKYKWRLASGGVCFVCAGRVAVSYAESPHELARHDRYNSFFAEDHPAVLHLTCRNCSFFSYVPVGVRLLDSPRVVGELAMRGVDTTDRFLWELPFVTDPDRLTVRSRDPWEVLVEATTPSGTLAVTLDDDAAVRAITTRPSEG